MFYLKEYRRINQAITIPFSSALDIYIHNVNVPFICCNNIKTNDKTCKISSILLFAMRCTFHLTVLKNGS